MSLCNELYPEVSFMLIRSKVLIIFFNPNFLVN
jgi:hypothetical protein